MSSINVDDSIDVLNINPNIMDVLTNQNINTIGELWNLKRKDLKEFGLTGTQINHIIVKMQLRGMDLNHKKY